MPAPTGPLSTLTVEDISLSGSSVGYASYRESYITGYSGYVLTVQYTDGTWSSNGLLLCYHYRFSRYKRSWGLIGGEKQ